MKQKPSLTELTHLAFQINSVIDSCPGFDLPIEDVVHASKFAELIERLSVKLAGRVDFSPLTRDQNRLMWLEIALGDAAETLRSRPASKVGVENSGLCLFIAIILEAIQQNHAISASLLTSQPQLANREREDASFQGF